MNLSMTSDSGTNRRFILLPPPGVVPPEAFRQVHGDTDRRGRLLRDMQRLRGRIYVKEGAISEWHLTPDGRHFQPIDERSWHLLILDPNNRVVGCTRYLQHPPSIGFHRLRVRTAAMAHSEQWGTTFRDAVEVELETARRCGLSYVEVGGWALDESLRGSSDAVRSVLFTYAWSQVIGGCLGLSTATHRNGSASILRRIGGRPLESKGRVLPPYYDSRYKCDMEVIRFDSRIPSHRYQQAIEEIKSQIPGMTVLCANSRSRSWSGFVERLQHRVDDLVPWPNPCVSASCYPT